MEDVGFPSPWACHPPFRPWMRHAMPANHISSRPWIIICFHHCWNNGTSCFHILEDCTGKHPRPVPQPHPKSSSMGTLVLRIDIRGLFKRHLCKYLRGSAPQFKMWVWVLRVTCYDPIHLLQGGCQHLTGVGHHLHPLPPTVNLKENRSVK